jgi:hypothetical protein
MLEATEGLFSCLGGKKAIAVEALARWVGQHPGAGRINSVLEQQIERIAKTLAKQSS